MTIDPYQRQVIAIEVEAVAWSIGAVALVALLLLHMVDSRRKKVVHYTDRHGKTTGSRDGSPGTTPGSPHRA